MLPAGCRTSSLALSVVGVRSADESLRFYRDGVGLTVLADERWHGGAFERHWRLPSSAGARAVLTGVPGRERGRILLLEFDAPRRDQVRGRDTRNFVGFNNLNFYSFDIRRSVAVLREQGYEFWTGAIGYDAAGEEGHATEALFEGPDGVIMNLVEPVGAGDTRLGRVRRVFDERGVTARGLTEVTTSAHTVHDIDAALGFYCGVLGFEIWQDMMFDMEEANRLIDLPQGSATRVVFVHGDDLFGKIAVMQPLNYEIPDLVARAVAPNIGYLAMAFECRDLEAALAACRAAGVELYSEPDDLDIPGVGRRRAAIVRTPGSGALTQLLQTA